jgi:hypothetical protein
MEFCLDRAHCAPDRKQRQPERGFRVLTIHANLKPVTAEMPIFQEPLRAADAHDQPDGDGGDHDLQGVIRTRRGGEPVVNPQGLPFEPAIFSRNRNQKGLRMLKSCWVAVQIGDASMCDYSLHAVATRPADVAETLVSTEFNTGTRGFAGPDNPHVAVCLRPGTEIAFEQDAQTQGVMLRKNIGDRLARFRQINTDKPHQHHDALEFSNGTIALVTDLASGQRVTVLQLPADPIEEKLKAAQPSYRYETGNV